MTDKSYIQRQVSMMLARDDVSSMMEAEIFPFRQRDVKPSTILKIDPGLRCSQAFSLAAAGTYTVQLPDDYDTAQKLHGIFITNGIILAVTTSPELTGTSSQLIKGTAADGRGSWIFQQRITSIVLSNPTAATVLVEYMLFQIPDLTVTASYRDGARTLGYVTTT